MFRKIPFSLLVSIIFLFSINILMVSSIAPSRVFRQVISWIIGIILFFLGQQINVKQINSSKWLIFIVSCILLFLPILLNNITRGSRRWLSIGPLAIQPSEIVKPWLMLVLVNSKLPLLHLIPVGIVLLQPDLGSAISILFLLIPIILYNKKFLKITLLITFMFILISPVIYSKVLHDYQRQRIVNFLDPNSDPLGDGYNVIQSKIAIGSGGFLGKGYKKGTQGQLLFLPEKHTDFMFAAIAEELGTLGVIVILANYFFLLFILFKKAFNTKHNRPVFLFALGITLQIWMQIFVNIGMNIGILPVTGIPLPFISVGGSSIISLLFSLGVIYST